MAISRKFLKMIKDSGIKFVKTGVFKSEIRTKRGTCPVAAVANKLCGKSRFTNNSPLVHNKELEKVLGVKYKTYRKVASAADFDRHKDRALLERACGIV